MESKKFKEGIRGGSYLAVTYGSEFIIPPIFFLAKLAKQVC